MLQKKDVIDDEIINEEIIYNGNENENGNDDDDDDDDILNDINEENKIIDSKIIQDIANEFEVTLPLQKKRGRKSKKEVDMLNKLKENNVHDDEIIYGQVKPIVKYKKRGRKPKGGKIIQNLLNDNSDYTVKTNVILHLKCFLSDLNIDYLNNNTSSYEGISLENNNGLNYNIIKSNVNSNINTLNNNLYCEQYQQNDEISENISEYSPTNNEQNIDKKNINKDIYTKLKELEYCLKTNNINNKKSACFFCTGDFDNPPIYIPKHLINGCYHVYGCFCSPECGTGFLMKEQIDSSIKYERYFLMNQIYSKIYNYEKSIKPAPNPYYTLDKFFGNLTIDEYRSLIKTDRLFILIDKPITRSLPELHEDNDDFIINNKIIPTNYQSNLSLNSSPGFVF
jgi:hypothetical protein|uniref:MYM-type domain-containing protein n=1 Tax=viral metagenome TaxID=1070528 RepID=A0A6C0ILC3_9ZZZZ